MGDSRRFREFASFLKRNFPTSTRIADVAGGHADLQTALRNAGFQKVKTFDKRKGHKSRPGKMEYKYGFFDSSVEEEFDLLVGMHPDEATDVIIVEAAKRKIPFVVVPCCVLPTATKFNGPKDYVLWVKHLKQVAITLGYKITETCLPIQGRNLVLCGRR